MVSDPRTLRFNELKKLAEERFSELSVAESQMLRASVSGDIAWCGPSDQTRDPNNDPSSAQEWGPEREIRAEMLRWLCVEKTAENQVDPRGVRVFAAKISGLLDLNDTSVRFPIALGRCRFTHDIWLRLARLRALSLEGSCVQSVKADSLAVDGSVLMCEGFIANGSVSLPDAQIGGGLSCHLGTFKNPGRIQVQESGVALVADRAKIKGSVHLRRAHFEGLVRLVGAQIDGNLSCNGGIFKNPAQKDLSESGIALLADCITVKTGIFLNDGFTAEGLVRLVGAHIDRTLDCQGGTFKNAAQEQVPASGSALMLDGTLVRGDVLFRTGFSAHGSVFMAGVRIDGVLDCHGGIFANSEPPVTRTSGGALRADGVSVQGSVFLGDGFVAKGLVALVGVQIALDLDCTGGTFDGIDAQRASINGALFWRQTINPENTLLNLRDASVGSFVDDCESWPIKLALDGFIYGRIAGGAKDIKGRLEWLRLPESFSPQPYRQLASFLRQEGDTEGSRQVLYEMERHIRRNGKHGWLARLVSEVFRLTIGYGLYPRRALWALLVLVMMGWGAYHYGYSAKAMAPTNKDAYAEFHDRGEPPKHYQHFFAFIYSAENCFPLVNLGQKEFWTPDPNQQGHALFLRWIRWIQIVSGWLLATFFVVGVTGIARKD